MGERRTYIINIDSMRADYFNLTGHQGCLTPSLVRLANEGTRFTRCYDILPANTSTNHTAIMTSSYAGMTGILGAVGCYQGLDFSHPKSSLHYGSPKCGMYIHRYLQVPTFFNTIKEHDPRLVTALIVGKTWIGNILGDQDTDVTIYPGNTDENCDQHKPNPDYVNDPEAYVVSGLAHPEDNELLPRYYIPKPGEKGGNPPGTLMTPLKEFHAGHLPSDDWVVDQAIKCINHDDPNFMYMILMNLDDSGHNYGAAIANIESDEAEIANLTLIRNPDAMRDQLFLTDTALGRFIKHLKKKGLYEDSRIIVTADHGMNTVKSVLTEESKQNILKWVINRFTYTPPAKLKQPPLQDSVQALDIDIRKILAEHGFYMRAAEPKKLKSYKSDGDYDWAITDGGSVGYLFNVASEKQEPIKKILLEYSIYEDSKTIHPIWKVLTEQTMDTEVNEYTGEQFHLKKGDYQDGYDPVWPSMMVFLKPHYMVPLYNDQIAHGITPVKISVNVPPFIDMRTWGGFHGTYSEQNVPLIFVSPSEELVPVNTIVNRQVSVLDIIPTIVKLNEWRMPSGFVGKSLFRKHKAKLPHIRTR
jgi:predicted AlkP superfamily pyrophosphatase or phosphodiesterase